MAPGRVRGPRGTKRRAETLKQNRQAKPPDQKNGKGRGTERVGQKRLARPVDYRPDFLSHDILLFSLLLLCSHMARHV
jgi:hypothetical protein